MSKIALVTGGQKGIGLGIAEALVGAGYKVALVSRSKNDAPDVAEALRKLGSAASYFSHDIQDVDGHAALMDRVEAEVGPVTTFVSNAGVPAKVRGDMLDIVPENFDFVLNVNLRGAFFLAQEAARRMINMSTDTYRSIAFVTSVSAEMVSIERAEYCISKAGAAMMAELFAFVNIGNVDFPYFCFNPNDRVPDSNRSMRIGAGVDHNKVRTIGTRGMDAIKQFMFSVALKMLQAHTGLTSRGA